MPHFLSRLLLLTLLSGLATGCIGTAIGQTTDAAIEVAKIPFKVGGAIIDVATGDDDDDEKKED